MQLGIKTNIQGFYYITKGTIFQNIVDIVINGVYTMICTACIYSAVSWDSLNQHGSSHYTSHSALVSGAASRGPSHFLLHAGLFYKRNFIGLKILCKGGRVLETYPDWILHHSSDCSRFIRSASTDTDQVFHDFKEVRIGASAECFGNVYRVILSFPKILRLLIINTTYFSYFES